jgi:general secretion pathway protein G
MRLRHLAVLMTACAMGCSRSPQIRDRSTTFQLPAIRTALDVFELDCGRYPTAVEGLASLITNPGLPGWRGPYLNTGTNSVAAALTDQWGTPLRYIAEGVRVAVVSAGPDRIFGTADDLKDHW